jgi:DNA-binding beta-propeller fold protein YncE/plastocyanin
MKKYGILGAALCLVVGLSGCSKSDNAPPPQAQGKTTFFDVTDEAGWWFDSGTKIGETRSLAVVDRGTKIKFLQKSSKFGPAAINGASRVESLHTVTSLIWPSTANKNEQIDQPTANQDDQEVTLHTPGLHVFVCKVHPYMLAGVIVDDASTKNGLDIGAKLHLLGVTDPTNAATALPSYSDIGLRLVRAFFVVTSPANWKDYTKANLPSPGNIYQPVYPAVPVILADKDGTVVEIADLNAALTGFIDGAAIPVLQTPATDGVGEVWVDTQYEETVSKGAAKPSTITVIDVAGANKWRMKQKIALPAQQMNNGHNMWASHDQTQIYQTEWHGKSLYAINRTTGELLTEIEVGHDAAHVMTRVDSEQVHVSLNGEDAVVELNKLASAPYLQLNPLRPGGLGRILMQAVGQPQSQPHAHWMGHDGHTMATPNSNSNDSTFFDFLTDLIVKKEPTGPLPIAAAMNPTSTKTYVSNYLGHSISVLCGGVLDPAIPQCVAGGPGTKIKDIPLLLNGNYDPITPGSVPTGPVGGLPIQTPVSPDGKFVITGNTLTGTITIIDAVNDTLVASVACDPGCHGVNFGAKAGGGYYAYVTSKFSNRLIVLDYDSDNDGIVTHTGPDAPVIAGWVVLADSAASVPTDDVITGNKGMGGQGVLPVPNVYNGWVQKLPAAFCGALTVSQRSPVGVIGGPACTP